MARKKREVKDRETREREIQAAAKEVFYRTGYQAASIEAIAKKANIAKGTIYLYYQNKGDLYVSLMIQGTQRINDNLTVLEDRLIRNAMTSGREIIMELLECFHQVYRADPDNVRIVAMFQLGDIFKEIPEDTVEKLNAIARKNNMAIRRILSIGKMQGLLKPETNELMLPDILWALFTGVLGVEESRKRVTQKDHIHDTLVQAYDLLTRSICVNADGATSETTEAPSIDKSKGLGQTDPSTGSDATDEPAS